MKQSKAFKKFITEYFANLKDISLFTKLNIDPGGYDISWTEDIDISCDELYENGR